MSLLECENWITLKCAGHNLTTAEEKFILSTLRPILNLSPAHSHFILDIFTEDDLIKGILKINSLYEKFSSEACAANIYRISTDLKNDILKKIEFWQQSKFISEAI